MQLAAAAATIAASSSHARARIQLALASPGVALSSERQPTLSVCRHSPVGPLGCGERDRRGVLVSLSFLVLGGVQTYLWARWLRADGLLLTGAAAVYHACAERDERAFDEQRRDAQRLAPVANVVG
jgi:hypothetical protein